jgi:hypothetical protein
MRGGSGAQVRSIPGYDTSRIAELANVTDVTGLQGELGAVR